LTNKRPQFQKKLSHRTQGIIRLKSKVNFKIYAQTQPYQLYQNLILRQIPRCAYDIVGLSICLPSTQLIIFMCVRKIAKSDY